MKIETIPHKDHIIVRLVSGSTAEDGNLITLQNVLLDNDADVKTQPIRVNGHRGLSIIFPQRKKLP